MKEDIYAFLTTIPRGKVVSYKIIALKFNIHPRYVAQIMASNEKPDAFPCYKVINSDGKIGGYNLGTDEKIRRLKSEGIEIKESKIDKSYFWNLKDR